MNQEAQSAYVRGQEKVAQLDAKGADLPLAPDRSRDEALLEKELKLDAALKRLDQLERGIQERESALEDRMTDFENSRQKLLDAAAIAGVAINEDPVFEEPKPGFDLRTHIRDPKSGRVVRVQNYTCWVSRGPDGNSTKIFERPVGKFFYENGEPAPQPAGYMRPGEKAPARRTA